MLNICLVYASLHLDNIITPWSALMLSQAFSSCRTCVGLVSVLPTLSACMSTCSASYVLMHASVCRLPGSEGFRQQLLKRTGKLVLLTPPRAGLGAKEVADYLEPILTVAAGGSLDVYRR